MEKQQFDKDLNEIEQYIKDNYNDYHFLITVCSKKNNNDEYRFGVSKSGDTDLIEQGFYESLKEQNAFGRMIFNSFIRLIKIMNNETFDFFIIKMIELRKIFADE